jgi:uncharacterized repeat protein (TIGR02543 family)
MTTAMPRIMNWLFSIVGLCFMLALSPNAPAGPLIQKLEMGYLHACALTTVGGVKCWGSNYYYGAVGNGTTNDAHSPVDIPGLTSGVKALAVGHTHSCAVTTAGAVKCWGNNSWGELGDGTTVNRSVPVDVKGLGGAALDVAVTPNGYPSGGRSCAIMASGGVKCWGLTNKVYPGTGTLPQQIVQTTPMDVPGLASGVVSLSLAHDAACAVMKDGGAKCWGENVYLGAGYAPVGNASLPGSSTALPVSGLGPNVSPPLFYPLNVASIGYPNYNHVLCTANTANNAIVPCSQFFPAGSIVTLNPRPRAGFRFLGWSGDCTGTTPQCKVRMDKARSVTATFKYGL